MAENSDNVKVIVRVRPLNKTEIKKNFKNVVEVDALGGTITLKNPDPMTQCPPKTFTFDHVFGEDSKQVDLYNAAARKIVDNVLEGYNGTIFAYGQTGTGKTFTMEGIRDVPELRGIIPNSFAHIFGHIARAGDDKNFLVRVSYLEIYNEDVRDLLVKDQKQRLEVRERPDIGVYVKDLSAFVVNNADDLDKIMTIGKNNRAVGSTDMNEQSSRSHAIFTITIECSERGVDGLQHVRMGKLHLVDLAGSERQSKTGATGDRFKEATKINLSLSTLGNVISSLVDGKRSHIPYRDSKLTRLLMDSLGGNAKTLMVANVGPADYNYDETLGTLRYANRAKNIQNFARINEDPKDALLKQFQKEIEELRRQLENEGDSEEGEESGEEDGVADDADSRKVKRRSRKLSEGQMKEIMDKIARERFTLEQTKDMEEAEKQRVAKELEEHEKALATAQRQRSDLLNKLKSLQKKVIVGGENLLEKAEAQQKLLEESQKELEERQRQEAQLKKAIEEKEAERLDMEEKYSSLQDEAVGKTKKIRKLTQHIAGIKAEIKDVREDHQREMEGLLDNVRQLARELQLQKLVIDSFIPKEYQELIDEHIHWNEDIGEWQLKCVAYTGNNMLKMGPSSPERKSGGAAGESDLSHLYISYADDGLKTPFHRTPSNASRPFSAHHGGRPKTAGKISRPKL